MGIENISWCMRDQRLFYIGFALPAYRTPGLEKRRGTHLIIGMHMINQGNITSVSGLAVDN